METKLTFKQWLTEAPLPDDWDKNVYSPNNSFAKQVKYAKERAQKVGSGSSRVAFKIEYQGRPTVLKIAKNRIGLAQNEQESQALRDYYLEDITIPMIDYDEASPQQIKFELTQSKIDLIKPYFPAMFIRSRHFRLIYLYFCQPLLSHS